MKELLIIFSYTNKRCVAEQAYRSFPQKQYQQTSRLQKPYSLLTQPYPQGPYTHHKPLIFKKLTTAIRLHIYNRQYL